MLSFMSLNWAFSCSWPWSRLGFGDDRLHVDESYLGAAALAVWLTHNTRKKVLIIVPWKFLNRM
jgi:hypothetical protein